MRQTGDGRVGRTLFGLAVVWGVICDPAWAGGAVAMQRQQQQQQQQMILMQRAAQEQAVMKQQAVIQQQLLRQRQHQVQVEQQITVRGLPAEQAGVKEIADLQTVVGALARSGRDWSLIIDDVAKEAVVEQFLARFRQAGVRIERPAWYYAGMIDSMSQESPEMLNQPFDRVVQVVAILEYDFNNGQNPDALAYQILGSQQAVLENRARLGL